MKTLADSFERPRLKPWKTLALAAFVAVALQPNLEAAGGSNPFSDNGDTVGSHPDAVIAGGGSEFQWRTQFFIEGPAQLMTGSLLQESGDGIQVEARFEGNVRFEFDAASAIRIDLGLLEDTRVFTGFRVAQFGSATRLAWDLGSHRTAATNVAVGTELTLPVTRLRRSGLLEQGLGIETFHRRTGRTGYSIGTDAGALVITRR